MVWGLGFRVKGSGCMVYGLLGATGTFPSSTNTKSAGAGVVVGAVVSTLDEET
jgi:hypothetical protein